MKRFFPGGICVLAVAAGLHAESGRTESGHDAWLRYPMHPQPVPNLVSTIGNSPLTISARSELSRALRGLTGKAPRTESGIPKESAIVVSALDKLPREWNLSAALIPDSYWLKTLESNGVHYLVVTGPNDRGVLYGTFAFLRKISLGESITALDEKQSPAVAQRWVNQWDRLDGSIERGYGGRSIFWEDGHARADLTRVADYGRLLASVGINGCAINNVNADLQLLTPEVFARRARIADAFRPWGVQVVSSVDFGSPKSMGGLDTFDPLDPRVAAWWKSKVDEVYRAIPDLGGFVMKADSEGRVGPSTYGRTHADAANVIARALKPYGGRVFYRGFVYDHHMDWHNPKNDRARAAYDNFKPLDGQFDDNVRHPDQERPHRFSGARTGLAALRSARKNEQGHRTADHAGMHGTGAAHGLSVPMWKETLDFDHARSRAATPVKRLGHGFVGVANAGLDDNWFGNHLSQANLYGFGRLAWNPGSERGTNCR